MALQWSASGCVSGAVEAQISRHVEDLGRNLRASTSTSVCKALHTSWRELGSGNAALSGQWAQVALDYSWEQLNLGIWAEVSVEWRRVYATAALLKALGLARAGEAERALETLDRGVLLGAPILDSALHKFASSLSASLHAHSSSTSALDGEPDTELSSTATRRASKSAKRIVFRNYKPLGGSTNEKPVETKRPRVEINVHDLASRTANVPLIDPRQRIPLVNLPPLDVFRQNHMITHTPVVISGALDTWPAYSARKWR